MDPSELKKLKNKMKKAKKKAEQEKQSQQQAQARWNNILLSFFLVCLGK